MLGGNTLNYTATAGHLTALSIGANPAPEASFFYVAYTLDGADPAKRPVTFFYNGGPGSATVWLHLGSFGPRRLAVNAPSTTTPLPFAFVDNTESLLDKSDLVFVDAVGTGFSEAIAPNVNQTFWGVDVDAAVFRDFVMRYVAVNNRGASPKFLFGESYGTPRSAVLASLLESAGTSLTGVVLQSSILNYNSNCGIFTKVTISCYAYLPSYGAIGAWLNLTQPAHPVAQLPDYMAQMRTLREHPIRSRGAIVPRRRARERRARPAARGRHRHGGQPMERPLQHGRHLLPRQPHPRLGHRLLRRAHGGAARHRARLRATIRRAPSTTRRSRRRSWPTSRSCATRRRRRYVILSNALDEWNFRHGGQSFPDTIPDLAAAMAHNPKLKVFSANGWYDIVTPFYLTENDIARLGGNPEHHDPLLPGRPHDLPGRHRAHRREGRRGGVLPGRGGGQGDGGAVGARAARAETPVPTGAMPPAVFESSVRDPAIPESLQQLTPVPPTQGAALAAQVEERLREQFESAPQAKRAGLLTRDQARAAGLGFVADNFDAIDVNHTGAVSFEDVKAFMRSRGAKLPD